MLVLPILSVQEVKEWTANSDLEELCLKNPKKVEKYIANLSWMIRTQIDKEQFKWKDDIYEIPDDLKFATINLFDIYYEYSIVNRYNIKWRKTSYSEKIDDYTITEWYSEYENTNQLKWLGVPVSNELYAVFQRYMPNVWFINVNIH